MVNTQDESPLEEKAINSRLKSWLGYMTATIVLGFAGFCHWLIAPNGWTSRWQHYSYSYTVYWSALLATSVLLPIAGAYFASLKIRGALLTRLLAGALAIQLLYAFIPVHRSIPDRWTFAFTLVGFLAGVLVFAFIKRFAPSLIGFEPDSNRKKRSQFSISSMLIWTTIVSIITVLTFNNEFYDSIPWEDFFFDTFWSFVIWLFAYLLVLVPAIAWLNKAKPFFMASLTLIVFAFVMTWAGCVIESQIESSWVHPFRYMSLVFASTIFAILFCGWIAAMNCFLMSSSPQTPDGLSGSSRWKQTGKWIKRVGFASTMCFGLATVIWFVVHYCVFTESRDINQLLTSKTVRAQLESAYPSHVVAAVNETCKSDLLIDRLNALNRYGLKREDNVVFRIAAVSRTRFDDPTFLAALGFTGEEIETDS